MKDAQLEEDLQALAKAFLLLKTEEVNRTLRDSTGGYQAVLERMELETDTKPES